jgi:hypothetical protein
MRKISDEIGLAEAAQLLRLPYQSAHRLVLMGTLAGEKRSGRWFVRKVDVVRLSRDASDLSALQTASSEGR